MSRVALLVTVVYILWLLANEARRREGVSPAVWIAVVWLTMLGSRPVSAWFDFGGSTSSAEAYDEGNPLERMVYFVLILQGLWVLARRGVRVRDVIACNGWLFIFFLYWGLSVFWADASFVAFKRWVKDIGNIVMVLVVLTDGRPVEAMKAVFVRSACLLLPMSVLFIRFIPELGRTYHVWSGEMMYTGVTTHKNSLGTLVVLSLMFLVWDVMSHRPPANMPHRWSSRFAVPSLIAIGVWLLFDAHSATATACLVVGMVLLVAASWRALRLRARYIEVLALVVGVGIWAAGGTQRLMDYLIVDVLERDVTLTSRTDVWPVLLSKVDSVLFGSGFSGFWTGERLREMYERLHIIQAHNGYLETYLNGGLLGLVLLVLVLLSAFRNTNRKLVEGGEYASLAFALISIAAIYNLTEASFNKPSPLWLAFLMMVTQYRNQQASVSARTPTPAAVTWRNYLNTGRGQKPWNCDTSR